jgi:hypothetical protein
MVVQGAGFRVAASALHVAGNVRHESAAHPARRPRPWRVSSGIMSPVCSHRARTRFYMRRDAAHDQTEALNVQRSGFWVLDFGLRV